MARCPECNARIEIPAEVAQFERVYCLGCGAELEVLSLRPLELEAVFDFDDDDDVIEELELGRDPDWDDDDDDDDDEW